MGGLRVFGSVFIMVAIISGAPDNRGTEFIIGYMENLYETINVELFVTTSRTTVVSVKVEAPKCSNPRISESFTVTAGQIKQLFFSPQIRLVGSVKNSKGIRISASDEVVIYGVNKERYSCDGFVGLPVDVLSDEYYVVVWSPALRQAELLVVGVHDGTRVSVTIGQHIGNSKVSYGGRSYGKGSTVTETLNKYDTWQLAIKADLTGSYVKGTKAISVFSGNKKTNIGKGGSSDHLVEHMTPVNTWGKTFATVPIPKRTVGDYFKFIASESNTRVTVSGGYKSSFTISSAGKYVQKLIPSKAYCKVVADKPILLIQFVQSQQSSSEPSDPSMMIIPPIEQFAADYTFTTPKYSFGSYGNYFMFIVEESEKSGLRIDGKAFPSNTKYNKISGTSLVGGYISIAEGSHTVRHTSPIAIFGGFLYGQARYETYGFTTGMRMAKVNAICIPTTTVTGDGIDNDCDGKIDEELCTPENKNKDDDGDGKVNEDCAKPPPIDGKWGSWTAYSTCTVTCKPKSGARSGTQTRTRLCNNPSPAYDGKQCSGASSETKTCTPSNSCQVHGNWGSWGSWGGCSVTCATGVQARTRACNNPAPSGGGNYCSGGSSSTKSCTKNPCPIDGKWANWGSWGSCSKNCGTGKKSRSRSCSNPKPQHNGKNCAGSSSDSANCNTHHCPIHGGWGSWGSYGSCSKTCGSGTQTRSRSCSKPKPQHGGNNCPNSASSSRSCNTHNCPIDGKWANWGSWGSCTKSCGTGMKSRSRSCSNPKPQHNGKNCAGSSSDSANCNTHHCPIHGGWGSWGSYGSCSKTCGSGTQTRSRSCSKPKPQHGGNNCPNSASSSRSCNTHNCPIDGKWANWGSWGSCTKSCGTGKKSRSRSCSNPRPQHNGKNCAGSSSDSANCNTHHCPIHGAWAKWGSYGKCTVTCGGGSQTRSRTCSNPTPQHGGNNCPNSASSSRNCNTHNCPIDGKWGSWSSYGSCTVTCGGGTQIRQRSCNKPRTQYGGAPCPGSSSSSRSCNTHHCPIDGKWSSWGRYGSCTVTCGGGTQVRGRTCTNPPPQYKGKACSGSTSSSRDCNTHHCPIDGFWSSWTSWASCTVTCGGGIQSRSRKCDKPIPQYGGAYCSGYSSATQFCNTQNCPIDGSWGSWSRWGTCTVTCGGGTQRRTRSCSNPTPQYGGASCPGSTSSRQSCNTQHCPIDGGLSTWTTWGACTVTCGGGTQRRSRSCTNPRPQYGGAQCSGTTSQTQDCNTQVCIIDGAWSQWQSWSSCSVSCGGGKKSRSRTCSNPRPANGGKSCDGRLSQLEDCNSQSCPTPAAGAYVQLCPTGWFTCQSGGITCIDKSFVCDCANDCDDGSDETTGYAGCSGKLMDSCENGSSAVVISPCLAFLGLLLQLFLQYFG